VGTKADPILAAAMARRAAALPEATARCQNDVGLFYEQGLAVTADKSEALRWYGLAAARGYPQAQANLARLRAGRGGTPESFDGLEY
jgi:TPR repeat protein